MNNQLNNVKGCFLGLAVGDALGVPVEFRNRTTLRRNPVREMTGYGAWNQPPGTWSDDSSMAFCVAESLLNGYNINDMANRFVKWMTEGYWGAHHEVFDVGGTTRSALTRVQRGENPLFSGDFEEESNGNGSLMRIAPAAIYFAGEHDTALLEKMTELSGITHRHFRSVFSCFIFSKFIANIISVRNKEEAFFNLQKQIQGFVKAKNFYQPELDNFSRVIHGSLSALDESEISSSGYVLHTLEASIWCFLNTSSYEESVLRAVNLGGDTDTTACVTGALAGLYYGVDQIPSRWINTLARKSDIGNLAAEFYQCISTRKP